MKKSRKTTMQVLKENGVVLSSYQMELVKKLDRIPNGRNACIVYKSDKSKEIKSAYNQIYKVVKFSTFSIQKGIDYNNKKSVQAKRALQIVQTGSYKTKDSWYCKLDNNIARSKTNENQFYLLAGLNTNSNAKGKSYYEVTSVINGGFKTVKMSSEELKALGIMRDSFWNKSSSDVDFRTFKLDDVLDVYTK